MPGPGPLSKSLSQIGALEWRSLRSMSIILIMSRSLILIILVIAQLLIFQNCKRDDSPSVKPFPRVAEAEREMAMTESSMQNGA